MSALTIERLRLARFGAVGEDVDLGAFDAATTVIVGPNETGKSTVVEALRCALFERHRTKHQGIRALVPHHSEGDPEVWLTFSLGADRYHVHKRFMKSALSELRMERPGFADRHWTGDEADAELWRALGAEPPSSRGRASATDLGAWGLLWVRQDDAATHDPGAGAPDRAREAISEAVGRQVNQALGGDGSERLLTRITEAAGRYFTGARQQATGALAEAERQVTDLEAEVAALGEGLRQTEKLAEQRKDLEARRAANRRSLESAQRALRTATARARQAQEANTVVHRSQLEAERARAGAAVARQQLTLRQARQDEAVAAAQRAADAEAVLVTLGEGLIHSATAAAASEAALVQAREAYARGQQALAKARRRWTHAQHAAARARQRTDLANARRLEAEIAELARTTADAPTDAAIERIEAEVQRALAAEARLLREGTRLDITPAHGPGLRVLAGRRHALMAPYLGPITLVPASPGLAEALQRLDAAAQRLADRLAAAAVVDLDAARLARAARAALAAEVQRAQTAFEQWAPAGLAALATRQAEVSHGRRAGEEALLEARSVEARALSAEAAIDEAPIDDATLARLEAQGRAVDASQARHDAAATRVELTALAPLAIRRADANDPDGAAELLPVAAGDHHTFDLTRPTTLQLGETARLTVTPGGVDAPLAARELEAARTQLAAALAERQLTDLDGARAVAAERRAQVAETVVLRQRLASLAPGGVPALARSVAEHARTADEIDAQCTRARELSARLDALRADLAEHLVDDEVGKRIEAAAQEADSARQSVEGLSARLSWPDGATDLASRPIDGECQSPAGPVTWHLRPGHGGAEAEVARTEAHRALAAALSGAARPIARPADAGSAAEAAAPPAPIEAVLVLALDQAEADPRLPEAIRAQVAAARARWQAGLAASARLAAQRQALNALAPAGLAALEARVAALGEDEPDPQEAGVEEPAAGQPRADAPDGVAAGSDPTRSAGTQAAPGAANATTTLQPGAEPAEAATHATVAEAEARLEALSAELEHATQARDDARADHAAHAQALAARRATAEASALERERIEARLAAEREAAGDEMLAQAAAEAGRATAEAEQALADAQRRHADAGGDDAASEAARQQAVEGEIKESDARLREQLAAVDARIRAAAAEGLFEQLAEAESELARAVDARTRMRRDAEAARRLLEVARRHHEETQARFLAPVIREVAPYLQKLRPGSRLHMQPDLKVAHVVRDGAEEAFDQLSGGTREQLAVIVRVALAQVLARDGRALPLILDDIMGWTDDGRFDRMMSILKKASAGLQIIVLTCHPERFLRLGARRTIDLEALRLAARDGARPALTGPSRSTDARGDAQ